MNYCSYLNHCLNTGLNMEREENTVTFFHCDAGLVPETLTCTFKSYHGAKRESAHKERSFLLQKPFIKTNDYE